MANPSLEGVANTDISRTRWNRAQEFERCNRSVKRQQPKWRRFRGPIRTLNSCKLAYNGDKRWRQIVVI
jgi:hypothetical protein